MNDCDRNDPVNAVGPYRQGQRIGNKILVGEALLFADVNEVEGPVGSNSEQILGVAAHILSISAANVSDKGALLDLVHELFHFRPGFVPRVAEVGSYLLIHFIHVFLLHIRGQLRLLGCFLVHGGLSVLAGELVLLYGYLFVLRVAQDRPFALAVSFRLDFSES